MAAPSNQKFVNDHDYRCSILSRQEVLAVPWRSRPNEQVLVSSRVTYLPHYTKAEVPLVLVGKPLGRPGGWVAALDQAPKETDGRAKGGGIEEGGEAGSIKKKEMV